MAASNIIRHVFLQIPYLKERVFMKYLVLLTATTLLLALTGGVIAQSPARRRTARPQPTAKAAVSQPAAERQPQPTPTVTTPAAAADSTIPSVLAILNGQTITVSDLDPAVTKEVAKLGEKVADARRQILDLQVNTVLLDVEAKKRKLTPQQVYELEVAKRITEPTEAEIAKLLEANRGELGQTDPATLRTEAIAFLRGQQEQKLSEDLIRRLKTANPVVAGADINSADLKPTTVVATVAGQPIVAGSLNERLKPIIYRLRLNAYQITNEALQRTLNDLVLLAEASRRNVPPENILRSEVTDKVHPPTDAEVEKFYSENKARITGDLASVKPQIANYLTEMQGQELERALSARLRKSADLRILITEPEQPVQVINTAGEPSRGDVNAPVTVVEFTDFECPACAAMHPVLEQVLPAYGNKVRLVVRNYPLDRHTHARKAAEAANAANAQGKFFEYTALLFNRQNALDVPSLKKYATEVGLDRARFDAELDRGIHAADVRRDLDDGQISGIESTPTIFVNGVMLLELSPEGLRAAIDKALSRAGVR
jgi:protein-disulfide isomerase